MSDVYIKIQASGGVAPVGATLMKTGQTTSYVSNDFPTVGRATDFFTLAVNNPFASTARFTDELGGTSYANDIMIDWSTYDNIAGTVLGYYRLFLSNDNFDNQVAACAALSIGSFTTGWRLWNIYEAMNICNFNGATYYNFSPLNITGFGGYCHTSTSRDASFCMKVLTGGAAYFDLDAKSNVAKGMAVRTFTVTGTTLS
jgi:hypothetical protein